MKKTILSLISIITISTSLSAMDDIYVGSGVAIQDAKNLDAGLALVVNAGMPLNNVDIKVGKLGVEGELTQSILGLSPNRGGSDIYFTTVGGYATYTYDINNQFYAKGRAGIVYYNPSKSYVDDGIDPSVSAGVGYKYNHDLSLYTEITKTDELTNLAVGVSYKLRGLN